MKIAIKHFLVILVACFAFTAAKAGDTIIVHKDARVDLLAEKQAAINKVTSKMTADGLFRGYRLQVLNTRSRDDAFKLKATLLENFPDQKAYVSYQSPYFKVRIGNFVQRADAENFKKQLSLYISNPAYVVDDVIEYIPQAGQFQ
ncbi:SPOR domain-containing protein [Parafilimonas sp.]|uniref:SPOR domain-containing protein n=1 Tax=Parafilimonas sp. TaxID=1969739 RepID=UPI0039E6C712